MRSEGKEGEGDIKGDVKKEKRRKKIILEQKEKEKE